MAAEPQIRIWRRGRRRLRIVVGGFFLGGGGVANKQRTCAGRWKKVGVHTRESRLNQPYLSLSLNLRAYFVRWQAALPRRMPRNKNKISQHTNQRQTRKTYFPVSRRTGWLALGGAAKPTHPHPWSSDSLLANSLLVLSFLFSC